jgi:hypothetical protein
MASQAETPATGSFIYSEARGTLSRENVTIVSGAGVLPAGRMLGKITASSKYTNYDDTLADGTQVAAGILYAEVDATSGDKAAVMICRNAEVVSSRVDCKTAGHKAAGITDLAVTNVFFR